MRCGSPFYCNTNRHSVYIGMASTLHCRKASIVIMGSGAVRCGAVRMGCTENHRTEEVGFMVVTASCTHQITDSCECYASACMLCGRGKKLKTKTTGKITITSRVINSSVCASTPHEKSGRCAV